jgi:hypothetical protein
VGGTCGTNGGEEERVWVIGRKARSKETTRKTRHVGRDRIVCCCLDWSGSG